MKTAKELLELRNKLEEEYEKEKQEKIDKAILEEWRYIEDAIDKFKVVRGNSYIKVNKIKYEANRDRLKAHGFFILDWDCGITKLYFDENGFSQDLKRGRGIKINSINIKSDNERYPIYTHPHIEKVDKTFPKVTIKWPARTEDYFTAINKLHQYLNDTK